MTATFSEPHRTNLSYSSNAAQSCSTFHVLIRVANAVAEAEIVVKFCVDAVIWALSYCAVWLLYHAADAAGLRVCSTEC